MTKAQKAMFQAYLDAEDVTIWDAYRAPSAAKVRAYNNIVRECLDSHGGPWVIPSHNSQTFTMAYDFHENGKRFLVYHTAYNKYVFEVS